MKVTIITPSYNQVDYISDTIKSVVSQPVELEYLIMDGASVDGSVDTIKSFAKLYPKQIHFISKKDAGQVDAINQGLRQATGDVIAYLNSDDYYLPQALKKVIEYFSSHPDKQWVYGQCLVSDPRFNWTFFLKRIWPVYLHPIFLKGFNTLNQPAVFIRKELVDKVGLFDPQLRYAFDYDYWLRCLKVAGTPGFLNSPLAVFRIHKSAKGSLHFDKQFDEDFTVLKHHFPATPARLLHLLGKYLTVFSYRLIK